MVGTVDGRQEYVVSVAVARDTEAGAADEAGDDYRMEVLRLTAANDELRGAPRGVTNQLQQSLDTGQQLARLAGRFGVDVQDLLEALDAASTTTTPPGSVEPDRHLSEAEAAALRRSGALQVTMPAAPGRASTRTAARAALVSARALTVGQVARLLGRTEGRIRQRLTERTMLGIRDARGWRIPAFQFDEGAELPGWDRVVAALPDDVHPLMVERFLDAPNPDLDLDGEAATPRRWLVSGGDIGIVVGLAAQLHRVA